MIWGHLIVEHESLLYLIKHEVWYLKMSWSQLVVVVVVLRVIIPRERNYSSRRGWWRGRFVYEFSHHSDTNGYDEHLARPSQQLVNYFSLRLLSIFCLFSTYSQNSHLRYSSARGMEKTRYSSNWHEVNGVRLPASIVYGRTWIAYDTFGQFAFESTKTK